MNRFIKWILFSVGFAGIILPIHLEIFRSVWVWISVSLIIGFFANTLNEMLHILRKEEVKKGSVPRMQNPPPPPKPKATKVIKCPNCDSSDIFSAVDNNHHCKKCMMTWHGNPDNFAQLG
ncbi:hypothetical protein [Cyclobacterium sediminis]